MRVLFFGTYSPGYNRNRVLIEGLRKNGAEVFECRTRPARLRSWAILIWKYLFAPKFDVMLVAFPGHELMPLARILTRKPIIFDAFASRYGGNIDRGRKASKFWDIISCRLADVVLLDTQAHIDYFVKTFGLSQDKFRRVFVGTSSTAYKPSPLPVNDNFAIHFHGYASPMHGVDTILEAKRLLNKDKIRFNLIGEGPWVSEDFTKSVAQDKLALAIAEADVCLGIFGNTEKAQLVIPNKIFEAIACGRPVITEDSPAIRELFTHKENIFLCDPKDPDSLISAIRELKEDRPLREKIAKNALKLFNEKLNEEALGKELLVILEEQDRKNPSILMYHNTPVDFEEQVRDIKSSNKEISITFDDGYENVYYKAFPVLKKYNISAMVFLITDYIGGDRTDSLGRKLPVLSWEQIKEMHDSGLVSFQPHTMTHPKLPKLNTVEVEKEILESKNIIESKLNVKCRWFAYPYGRYDDRVLEIVRKNFDFAVTVRRGYVSKLSDPHQLPRNPR